MKEQFYIKYEPEITEDKYEQLVKKIEQLGYIFIEHCNWKNSYKSFKKEGYLRSYSKGDPKDISENRWCIDNNKQNITKEKFLDDFLQEKEQILTIEQLIEGEVYWSTSTAYEKGHLWKFDYFDKDSKFIYSKGALINNVSKFEKKARFNDAHHLKLRKATIEESRWFETCLKENKFIELDKGLPKQEESLIGRWVKCIQWGGYSALEGNYYQITEGKGNDLNQYEIEGNNTVYLSIGKWELMPIGFIPPSVNEPIKEENMLRKNDYIVLIKASFDMDGYSLNYCYKQKNDNGYFLSEYDNKGRTNNGYSCCTFDNKGSINWRYATSEEIAEYNRIGKPFDVTTLNKQEDNSIPEYVEWISNTGSGGYGTMSSNFKEGKIFCTKTDNLPLCGLDSSKKNWKKALTKTWYLNNFKPSTKTEYDLQNNIKIYPYTTSESLSNTYAIGADPYNKEEIEIGDEVEIIQDLGRNNSSKKIGDKFIVQLITSGVKGNWIHFLNKTGEGVGVENLKLIRKKNTTSNTTTYHKKLDVSSAIQVGNENIVNITIPKSSSVMLKNTENEIKINIKNNLTIKI